MKTFFASMLGSMAALFIFALLVVVAAFGFVGFVAMATSGSKPVMVEDGAYLVFDLNADISDAPPEINPLEMFTALEQPDRPKALQLRTVTRALLAAAKDARIKGMLITGRMVPKDYGSSLAALKEVRDAITAFRESGKPVVAFLNDAGTREIYLASVASDLVLDPYGQVALPGLASEPMFFAGALDRLGVGVQVARVGKYKSAVEPFLRENLSAENREQLQKLLDDLWQTVRDSIATARGIAPEALQALVDTEGNIRSGPALESKLVNRIAYRDEVIADLKKKTGQTGAKESFKQIDLASYAKAMTAGPLVTGSDKAGTVAAKHGKVAVVYAEGAIVDGEGRHGEVGGASFSRGSIRAARA